MRQSLVITRKQGKKVLIFLPEIDEERGEHIEIYTHLLNNQISIFSSFHLLAQ